MHNWNDSIKGVVAAALTGIVVGVGGFFLAHINGTHAMGPVAFLLVPLAAGFAITMVSHGVQRVSAAAILATIVSLGLLIVSGLETPLCARLALPLLFAGLMAGVALGYLFLKVTAKRSNNSGKFRSVVLLATPILILAGHRVEEVTPNPSPARSGCLHDST